MDDVQWRFSHGNKVEAKYCPIEIDGDVKYYICPRHEICCTFGCCVSSNFHFYQLWYYWLMVILMFLLCSGGTWWYRYWLQEGHYPHVPPPSHRPPPPRHRPPSTRVTYHPGRTTRVVVQHTWKPQRVGSTGYATPPPSYSFVQSSNDTGDQSTASGATSTPTQGVKPRTSPYYQLYGPPPSYDSVVTGLMPELRQNDQPHTREQLSNSYSFSSCDDRQEQEHNNAHIQRQHERLLRAATSASSSSRSNPQDDDSVSHK